jgi:hypothetical protein
MVVGLLAVGRGAKKTGKRNKKRREKINKKTDF